MEAFDIVHHPLKEGTCLIEAGAGTGKTYALTAIFLRLLLERQLPPERILVVTFTTAATAELRERLRRQLVAVRRFIDGEDVLDDTLKQIVAQSSTPEAVRQRVAAALQAFDHFAVFTIHGFCQRLLNELAFETASPFEIELVSDPSEWIQEVADDYWREVFFDAAPELADYALNKLYGPESLAVLYQRYGMPDLRIIPDCPQRPRVDLDHYRRCCATLRRQWPTLHAEVAARLQSPALNGRIYGSLKPAPVTKRSQKVDGWCQALTAFLHREPPRFPPCAALTYFTTAKITASTRKGQTPPRHAFFEACQALYTAAEQLQKELDAWLTALRIGFFAYANQKLNQAKQTRRAVFFDDLLGQVRDALEGQHGDQLATAVQRRYQVALVDEFQDTDTTQYHIFKRLFANDEHLLFMIGDPKQAIYGFRGADIFSYLEAARQAGQQRTLVQNWRSQPNLIQAINTLFGNRTRPFLMADINYHMAVAAPTKNTAASDRPKDSPLIFWLMPTPAAEGTGPARPLNQNAAAQKVLAAVAVEVKRLLVDSPSDAVNGGDGGISARDMAVLVRTNRQARMAKTVLQKAGVPAVIQNAGNVFDTPEAEAFTHVLQAVVNPGDTCRLKTALATRLFGYSGDRLAAADQGIEWLEEERRHFFSYQAVWQQKGFFPFFRRLLNEHRIAENLLGMTDGERRLTNLLHLAELLHQATISMRGSLREALRWMNRQKAMLYGRLDEQLLRMESDAEALTILTIHKSKGLEFPIVFCPFSWQSDVDRDEWPLFHDREAGMRRTLDLSIDAHPDHQDQARQERLAESLRLLYVAITRARSRCYLVWGDLPTATDSALGYLLTTAEAAEDRTADGGAPQVSSDGAQNKEIMLRGLERLESKSNGSIALRILPDDAPLKDRHETPAPDLAPERRMHRRLVSHWTITSFSSLTRATAASEPSAADHDQKSTDLAADPVDAANDNAVQKLADDMHLFPRGAHAGNLFHRLFEILDYRQTQPGGWQDRVTAELVQYGFDRHWTVPVTRLIQNVLATPLPQGATPFSLNRLGPNACVKELPFCFPLNRFDAEALGRVFNQHQLRLSRDAVAQQIQKLDFIISSGFLRGFIDLFFQTKGRYYILDWKSNFLGETYRDYSPERIHTVMAEDYYFLQYHLYALAMDQFLRSRRTDYDYERDFGGVYYLFIRGMRPDQDAPNGIFFDRPDADLLADLRGLLLKSGQISSAASEGPRG